MDIAEIKYPKEDGWRHVWVFDHSSCHAVMADDALDVNKMNVNPGGKQRVMRDTVWQGQVQKMNFSLGVPKGMRTVLNERGVDTTGRSARLAPWSLFPHPYQYTVEYNPGKRNGNVDALSCSKQVCCRRRGKECG